MTEKTTSSNGYLSLEAFAQDAKLSDDEFEEIHGRAFFVHHGARDKLQLPPDLKKTIAAEQAGTDPAIPFNPRADFVVFPIDHHQSDPAGDDLIWIGRSQDNDVVIHDESISAVHAFVKPDQDRFFIRDMASMNGSFVNEEAVPAQGMGAAKELASGDKVRLGTVKLRFLRGPEFLNLLRGLFR